MHGWMVVSKASGAMLEDMVDLQTELYDELGLPCRCVIAPVGVTAFVLVAGSLSDKHPL